MSDHRCGLFPGVKSSETASAVTIFNLPVFCDEPVALLIHNTEEVRRKEKGGGVKPANWGVPGGGIKQGEKPEAAVLRELCQETGINAFAGSAEEIFFRHSFMFKKSLEEAENEDSDKAKPAYVRCDRVMDAIHFGQVDEADLIHQSRNWAFFVRCEPTEGLLEFFERRRLALALGAEPAPEESEYGSLVVRLDNEWAEALNIVEAIEGPCGRQEIDAIGLFPLSQIELIREAGPKGFSRSHMGYIMNAAKRLSRRT